MARHRLTRGERNVRWIENYCVRHGAPAQLSAEERCIVYQRYDAGQEVAVEPPLAAFLSLLHLLGVESCPGTPPPPFATTIFELWASAGPNLRPYLRQEGERILCDQRGTAWSRSVAA